MSLLGLKHNIKRKNSAFCKFRFSEGPFIYSGWIILTVVLSIFSNSVPSECFASDQIKQKSITEKTGSKRYSFRKEHDPNGIGKFYLDREIAHVMGYLGADWLERPQREKEEKLSLLVRSLKIKPGMNVADIGAGSGVISLLVAEKVGVEGKVFAVDVQDEMLELLDKKLKKFKIKNIHLTKGTSQSPNLKKNSVDLIFMVDVYHEFEFPYEMLDELSNALKPGGRIAFVEYRMEDPKVPIKLVHKMSVKQVRKEAEQPEFQLKWIKTIDVLPRQHIILFEKQAEVNN
jgi:ubiquinone/menaquinone biosynthesis C-methylase UbiE